MYWKIKEKDGDFRLPHLHSLVILLNDIFGCFPRFTRWKVFKGSNFILLPASIGFPENYKCDYSKYDGQSPKADEPDFQFVPLWVGRYDEVDVVGHF